MLSTTKSRLSADKVGFAGKTFLQTLFFFLLVTQICFAQWYQQNSGVTKDLNDVAFDGNLGIAVGDFGTILRTTDEGINWTIQLSATTKDLNGIGYNWYSSPIVVGDSGIVLISNDRGISWTQQTSITISELNAITLWNCPGYIVGDNGIILKTPNDGLSWEIQQSGNPYPLNSVSFIDGDNGWAVGGGGGGFFYDSATVLHTSDGGINWLSQLNEEMTGLYDVHFVDENIGWAVGGARGLDMGIGGIIIGTIDGGANWKIILESESHMFYDISIVDQNLGFIVGSAGQAGPGLIMQSHNGGVTWIEQIFASISALRSVFFIDDFNGWTVGDGGVILHTTNGGVVPVELNSFTATANGKEVTLNWSTATELNNQGFEAQRKFGPNDFLTIGSVKGHGTTTSPNNYAYVDKLLTSGKYFYRLKQIDFGGKYEYSQTVEVNWSPFTNYMLEQNYPNPFNPTTTIGFGIPEKGNVRLSVLNILGEEIKVLLNEEKEAGYHSVEFDASNLPSSVYFYRIQSVPSSSSGQAFIDTKKMLLLK
jgi:photosystem II stability/assembly factor-like uncharacterized protein